MVLLIAVSILISRLAIIENYCHEEKLADGRHILYSLIALNILALVPLAGRMIFPSFKQKSRQMRQIPPKVKNPPDENSFSGKISGIAFFADAIIL